MSEENPEDVPTVEESIVTKDGNHDRRSVRPGIHRDRGYVSKIDAMTIPTHALEQDHVHAAHGHESWQAKVLHIVHTNTVVYILTGLLLLDVMILFVELYLSAEYPFCHIVERDAISCCNVTEDEHHDRFLTGDDEHHDLCEAGSQGVYEAACDPHKYPGVHTAHVTLRSITIAILSIFFIELCALIAAMGPGKFFRCCFYLLDFVVVSISLALEITFIFLDDSQVELVLGLLIAARLWRFVRIGHGIFEATHELSSKKHSNLQTYTQELEALLKQNGIEVPDGQET